MVEYKDYLSQDSGFSNFQGHTDEGYDDHDDHNDHVDLWVDEGDQDLGHSGHCDSSD